MRSVPIRVSADRVFLGSEWAGKKSSGERRPRDRPDPKELQQIYDNKDISRSYTHLESRKHFSLLLAIDEIVMVLHRDEWC